MAGAAAVAAGAAALVAASHSGEPTPRSALGESTDADDRLPSGVVGGVLSMTPVPSAAALAAAAAAAATGGGPRPVAGR